MGMRSFTVLSLVLSVCEISVIKSFVLLVILINNTGKLLYFCVHFFEYLFIDCLFLGLLLSAYLLSFLAIHTPCPYFKIWQ